MATSAAAALLDELMGRNRNVGENESKHELAWDDDQVCKYHICGLCPHELFTNTRADLGICNKIHDDEIKKSYEKSSRVGRMGYEEELQRFLNSLLADVHRRIERGRERLAISNTNLPIVTPPADKQEQIDILTRKINDLVQKAEEAGCEGNVEEAQGMMKLCDQLREERSNLEERMKASMPTPKEMEVCEVCGAFLVIGDAQQRQEEHLMGKQHVGYAKIRTFLDGQRKPKRDPEENNREIEEKRKREDISPCSDRSKKRRSGSKEGEADKKRRRSRSGDRYRDERRDRERDRNRDRDRDRGRSGRGRDGDRYRERERDRDKGEKGDKDRSTRERERSDRARDKDKTDRDRDRDRHRDKYEHDRSDKTSDRDKGRREHYDDKSYENNDIDKDKSREHDSSKKRWPDHRHHRNNGSEAVHEGSSRIHQS